MTGSRSIPITGIWALSGGAGVGTRSETLNVPYANGAKKSGMISFVFDSLFRLKSSRLHENSMTAAKKNTIPEMKCFNSFMILKFNCLANKEDEIRDYFIRKLFK